MLSNQPREKINATPRTVSSLSLKAQFIIQAHRKLVALIKTSFNSPWPCFASQSLGKDQLVSKIS